MRVYILAHEEAITRWRWLMGPTKVYRARYTAPESIRGTLGLTDTRNSVHGSGCFRQQGQGFQAGLERAVFIGSLEVPGTKDDIQKVGP
ncbi:Nucleoside diphosphate kinase 6, partial [Ophiophagus hannah]